MDYDKMSNMEINAIHVKMLEEYEAIKQEILVLWDKMDEMDAEFQKGKAVLDKRLKR